MELTASTLHERLVRVKEAVGGIAKRDRNDQGRGYNFRGIDRVVNAVAPAMIAEGILVRPTRTQLLSSELVHYGANNTVGFRTLVLVTFEFSYADERLEVQVLGEAIDSGDKSGAKAMSVAFRTALLQALTLPTDEADPDSETYEVLRTTLVGALKDLGFNGDAAKTFISDAVGHEYTAFRDLTDADLEAVLVAINLFRANKPDENARKN